MDILITPRLTMRPAFDVDAESITDILNNPLVSRHLSGIPYPFMLCDAYDWIRESSKNPCSFTLHRERLVGAITVHNGAQMPLLNFWISPDFWGFGYMSEALRAVLPLAFRRYDADIIAASIFTDNSVSLRILESLCFSYSGKGMLFNPARGEGYPTHKYILTCDVFRRSVSCGDAPDTNEPTNKMGRDAA